MPLHKGFVPAQKLNLLCENHRLVWHKKWVKFGTGTICKSVFDMAQKKLDQPKNVLGPVKGQGINAITFLDRLKKFELSQNN